MRVLWDCSRFSWFWEARQPTRRLVLELELIRSTTVRRLSAPMAIMGIILMIARLMGTTALITSLTVSSLVLVRGSAATTAVISTGAGLAGIISEMTADSAATKDSEAVVDSRAAANSAAIVAPAAAVDSKAAANSAAIVVPAAAVDSKAAALVGVAASTVADPAVVAAPTAVDAVNRSSFLCSDTNGWQPSRQPFVFLASGSYAGEISVSRRLGCLRRSAEGDEACCKNHGEIRPLLLRIALSMFVTSVMS